MLRSRIRFKFDSRRYDVTIKICYFGFIYHFYLTSKLFLDFDITIEMEIQEPEVIIIPKVAFCYRMIDGFDWKGFTAAYKIEYTNETTESELIEISKTIELRKLNPYLIKIDVLLVQ